MEVPLYTCHITLIISISMDPLRNRGQNSHNSQGMLLWQWKPMVQVITMPRLRIFFIYFWFYKSKRLSRRFVGRNIPTTVQTYVHVYVKKVKRGYTIKSAVDQKKSQIGMVITWTISIAQIFFFSFPQWQILSKSTIDCHLHEAKGVAPFLAFQFCTILVDTNL